MIRTSNTARLAVTLSLVCAISTAAQENSTVAQENPHTPPPALVELQSQPESQPQPDDNRPEPVRRPPRVHDRSTIAKNDCPPCGAVATVLDAKSLQWTRRIPRQARYADRFLCPGLWFT
jgi:hypothetical protein